MVVRIGREGYRCVTTLALSQFAAGRELLSLKVVKVSCSQLTSSAYRQENKWIVRSGRVLARDRASWLP